jgi:CelD/BcsL family acetyltransferase involved in cellulose biosynthesis/predicted ATP-grasp superfamily ATP-dependent carboligase
MTSPTRQRLRVLVTDGNTRAALAVTRSLGRAGHEVIVGEKESPALAQTSVHCAGRVSYPDPAVESDAFVDALAESVRTLGVDVLLPVADITTFLVTGNRERFPDTCRIPFAPASVIERAADKVDILQTAMRLGVPVPNSVIVNSPSELDGLSLQFPLVIKPRQSRVRTASRWEASSVSYADDRDGVVRDLQSRPAHEFPVMLQERIVGPGVGVFACYHHGRPVAVFSHRRLRERPPWGGVSVLCESVEADPVARDCALRLLDDLKWHGVAMVEFKRDLSDGLPKLMEINGRFWGSLQLAIDAGVDFPALLVETLGDAPPTQPGPYRTGVRSRWLWGDIESLILRFTGSGGPPRDARQGRSRAIVEFLKLWGRDLHYENPRWGDLGPWWFETATRLGLIRPHAAAPAAAMNARVVPSLEEVGLDESAWNALVATSETNSVFQTHQWTRSWWSAFGERYAPLFITASRDNRVMGVAALVVEHRRRGGRVVKFLGHERADYCDIIAGADKADVVTAVLHAVFREARWDIIELSRIPGASSTVELVRRVCEPAGYRCMVDDEFTCPTLLIEGHEAEARQIFNNPGLRRRVNYFERQGHLLIRDLKAASDVEPYLDAFFRQHITRWQSSGSPSLFLAPDVARFYRLLATNLADAGWLLFSVVELDGHPLAFHYGFDYNGSLMWYKPSFNIDFAKHSPGLVMLRHLIGYALERKRQELDFTLGDEPFKRRFTNYARKTTRVRIFRHPASYAAAQSRRAIVDAVRHLVPG